MLTPRALLVAKAAALVPTIEAEVEHLKHELRQLESSRLVSLPHVLGLPGLGSGARRGLRTCRCSSGNFRSGGALLLSRLRQLPEPLLAELGVLASFVFVLAADHPHFHAISESTDPRRMSKFLSTDDHQFSKQE